MLKKNQLYLSVVTALFAAHTAVAQESKADAPAVDLGSIQVTSSSLGYDQVNAVKIQTRNATMVKDVMRDIPGVYVGGTNSMNQKIYMRGVNDRGLNITIDGARQRGNAFHHHADLIVDMDLLKAVDISTGIHSVVGNAGALGGSVAFKTVDASDMLAPGQRIGGRAKFQYDSNDSRYTTSAMLYGEPVDGLELLGYFGYSNYDYGEDGRGLDIGGRGNDRSYLFKGSYGTGDHRIGLSYEHVEYDGDYPFRAEFGGEAVAGDGSGVPAGQRYQPILPQEMGRDTVRLNYTYNPNDYINLDFNAYYTDHYLERSKEPAFNELKKSGKTPNGYRASLMDGGVKTYGATLINTTILNQGNAEHTLRYGVEFYQSKSYLNYYDNFVEKTASGKWRMNRMQPAPDDKATSYSVFIEDQIRIGGLTLVPGVRLDHYRLNSMGQGGGKGSGITSRETTSWTEVSPAIAVDYQFDNGIGLFGSYARVFRGPDPIESIRLTQANAETFASADSLEPETGDAYEIGARYSTSWGLNNSVSVIAKYFYTDYNNLINEFASPASRSAGTTRINAGKATIDGVELAARGQFGNFGIGAGYTHQETDYKSQTQITRRGQVLPAYGGILGYSDSGDKYTLNMDYLIEPADLLVGYNMIYFDSYNKKGTRKKAYATHDIFASWQPKGQLSGLEVNVGIYNLFDEDYYSHTQRIFGEAQRNDWEPGRNVRASISYRY